MRWPASWVSVAPCRLVLVLALAVRSSGALDVVAASGLRERRASAPASLWTLRPARWATRAAAAAESGAISLMQSSSRHWRSGETEAEAMAGSAEGSLSEAVHVFQDPEDRRKSEIY